MHIYTKNVCMFIDRKTDGQKDRQTDMKRQKKRQKVKYAGIYAWDTCRA